MKKCVMVAIVIGLVGCGKSTLAQLRDEPMNVQNAVAYVANAELLLNRCEIGQAEKVGLNSEMMKMKPQAGAKAMEYITAYKDALKEIPCEDLQYNIKSIG
ncbi:hypothetical protein HGP28_06735 [Vibrio sp. SM6]|uniref:Lipoprotein n=1 Tax=Vibrio agarilyticus TaxID=2726741 RepID=A0A7X8TQW9_9VIBR|nr:hypothetical protein [Vibrio agarilyticus]NLS12598.1 hypothetical protein [Vibrio agarilyticus]